MLAMSDDRRADRSLSRLCCVGAVLLLLLACAPTDARFSPNLAMHAAQQHFGVDDDIKFYTVASSGALRDTAVIVAATFGFSTTAEKILVGLLESAGERPFKVTVTGPAPNKTYRILLGALGQFEGRGLSNVQLLLIGPSEQRAGAEAAARAAGIDFSFISFQAMF
jgi:hypothetical protein